MAKTLKKGDKVEWNTSQGKTKGTVKKKLTKPMKIKGHKVAASKSNPEYLVESSKSGDKAAHKAESLKKVSKTKGAAAKKSTKKASASKKSTSAKKTSKVKSAAAKKSTTARKSARSGTAKKGAAKKSLSVKKSTASTRSAKSTRAKSDQSPKEKDEVIKEFKSVINIPPSQLERWLDQPESKKVGFKDEKKGESVGHESGRRILRILAKRRDKLSDEDLSHMKKVVGYVHRHKAQKPKGDIVASNWRYSLMNWGHDPAK